jgi:PAS domain S-box-containing protein
MMPELDGFGLAMEMRKDPTLRRLPLLLITSSYVEGPDRDLARRAGATDLVPRTPELGELFDALRVVLHDDGKHPDVVVPEHMPEIEAEHSRRVFRQLERQVSINTGLAKRCSALASELTVLTNISEAVLQHSDIGVALDDALAECFDAGGIAVGALYLVGDDGLTVRSIGSAHPLGTTEELLSLFGRVALLHEVIYAGRTILIPHDLPAAIAEELLGKTSASALLLVPLLHLGKSLGGLLMATRTRSIEHGDWRTFATGVATQITQALTLARAYSDREVAERRATQQAALLNALVESAPDLIVQVDVDGTIRFMNGPFRGKPPAELIGSSWFELASPTERASFETVVTSDTPVGYETHNQVGQTFSVRLGPVRDKGKVIAVVVVARDVTEKKQGEVQLMLADRMASVGTLAAGVAHEINNPLAAVIANLDMAIQDVTELGVRTPLPGDLVDELRDARTAADRVREIVRDLKIFSRAEEDRHGPVEVQRVLESTLRMAWNELRHRARVVKSYAPDLPLVDANESRLGQVFLNLIINAAHAIPEGKYETNEIRIGTARAPGGGVVISIGDTGGGIPPELRSRLFTPFFTTKPAGVGTGLGLAISHKIITAYGGTITFESTVGTGTVFHVTLPIAGPVDQDRTTRVPKIVSETPLRRGTILVIDDEETLGLAIKRFLSPQHDVTTVTGARAAIELFEAGHRYDVIFCDLMMPQITGMELHAEVTARFPAQVDRMIFVTGGAFTTAAREFLDTVSNRRVEKPFDLKVLRGLVNDLIR